MIEQEFVIKIPLGLHARPAGILVQRINKYKSSVKIIKGDEEVNGKSMLGILTLAVAYGEKIKVIIDGEDEQEAMETIRDLIEHNFYIEYVNGMEK